MPMQMVISPPFFQFSVSCSLSAFAFEFSLPTLPPAAAPSASSDLPLPGELSFSRVLAVSRCPSGTMQFSLSQISLVIYVTIGIWFPQSYQCLSRYAYGFSLRLAE